MYGKEAIGSKEGQKGLAERKSNEPCSFLPSATSQWNDVIPNMKRLKDGFERLGLGVPVKPYVPMKPYSGFVEVAWWTGRHPIINERLEHPSLVTGKFGCGET
jgi:hypothetical protein